MAQADPTRVLQRIVAENARLSLELIAADETVQAERAENELLKRRLAQFEEIE